MTKIIKTCTKPLHHGHLKLHFYAMNNVFSHTQPGLLPLSIKKLSQYSFPSGTRLIGYLHVD